MNHKIERTLIALCLLAIMLGLTIAGVNFVRAGMAAQVIESGVIAFVVLVVYVAYDRTY